MSFKSARDYRSWIYRKLPQGCQLKDWGQTLTPIPSYRDSTFSNRMSTLDAYSFDKMAIGIIDLA